MCVPLSPLTAVTHRWCIVGQSDTLQILQSVYTVSLNSVRVKFNLKVQIFMHIQTDFVVHVLAFSDLWFYEGSAAGCRIQTREEN